jgi:hypothetical protein
MTPLVIAITGAVLLVLLIGMAILSRIRVAGPNEAFIVTGRKGHAVRAVDGWPPCSPNWATPPRMAPQWRVKFTAE